jgi:hypothetical protein
MTDERDRVLVYFTDGTSKEMQDLGGIARLLTQLPYKNCESLKAKEP